jgi:hypothetical protein
MKHILTLSAVAFLASCAAPLPPPPPYCPPPKKTWTAPKTTAANTKTGRNINGRFIEDVPPEDVEPVSNVIRVTQ